MLFSASCASRQPGAPINPGFNVYSKQQDIQLGQEAAQQVRQQVDIVNNSTLQNYIKGIGQRLARQPAAEDYPYSFTLINDDSINAFALPGGPIFVNSGLIDNADNEAQVAGVLAHEISHVVLRHGTSQASKAQLIQLPAVLGGAILGSESVWAQLGQLGIALGANSVLLKYSRDAENEADALGARILAQANYNPIEMARFFEKLQSEGGSGAPEFFSSHPAPENRVQKVEAEIQAMPQTRFDPAQQTAEFQRMKQMVAQLPPSRTPQQPLSASNSPSSSAPVQGLRTIDAGAFRMGVPSGWQIYQNRRDASVTVAPRNGITRSNDNRLALGYGMVAGIYPANGGSLSQTTDQFLRELSRANPRLNMRQSTARQVGQNRALFTELTAPSPFGGQEANWLVTVDRPNGLFYAMFVAPQSEVSNFQPAVQSMIQSIQFR